MESTDPVKEALDGADLLSGITEAQGLVIAAVLAVVAFVFLRKVFGK